MRLLKDLLSFTVISGIGSELVKPVFMLTWSSIAKATPSTAKLVKLPHCVMIVVSGGAYSERLDSLPVPKRE